MKANHIRLRVADMRDKEAVESIYKHSYVKLLSQFYDPQILEASLKVMERANPKLLSSGQYHIAISEENLPVGCGGWTWEDPRGEPLVDRLGNIRHFATRADWTKQGIGRLLYDRCQAQAIEEGAIAFRVYASLNAVPFYESLGFEVVCNTEQRLSEEASFPCVWMHNEFSL